MAKYPKNGTISQPLSPEESVRVSIAVRDGKSATDNKAARETVKRIVERFGNTITLLKVMAYSNTDKDNIIFDSRTIADVKVAKDTYSWHDPELPTGRRIKKNTLLDVSNNSYNTEIFFGCYCLPEDEKIALEKIRDAMRRHLLVSRRLYERIESQLKAAEII